MPAIDFKALGKTLALSEMGVPVAEQSYFDMVEEDSYERARLAANFCKEASMLLPNLGEEGVFAGILMKKIASTPPEDIHPDIVDFALDQAYELHQLTKEAGLPAAATATAANYAPTLLKGFLALAILSGATAGAAGWAGRRALQGPDEDEIAKLEAGIKEYHKLKGRVDREKENEKIEQTYLG
jgi:hypothetical protein